MKLNQNDTMSMYTGIDTLSVDSIIVAVMDSLPDKPEPVASLFSEVAEQEIIERPNPASNHPNWIPGLIVACFILLAWGRLFYRRRMQMIFRSILAKNYANQLIREGNIFNESIGLILFVIYLASMGMMVYLALPLFEVASPFPSLITYLMITGGFLFFWLLKAFIVKVLALLFNTNETSGELISNMYVFNLFVGILLLPLISCMAFAQLEVFFYIALIIITITYTIRIIREVLIGISVIKFSVFHLFLYLCTLEILPLIVLAKILTRNMIL